MPALIQNGVLAPPGDTPSSAAELLRTRPRGAYTALTVLRGELIPHWQWHTERLAASLVDLAAACPADFPAFSAWHAGGPEAASPLPLASHLGNEALPSLAAAVRAAGAAPGGDVGVVLLLMDAGETAAPGALEPPLDVRAYAWALPPPDRRCVPGPAAVAGPLRPLPSVKDSAWATERAGMEARLPPGVADGLLTSGEGEGGALVEGLVTNLFVVQASSDGGGGGGGGGGGRGHGQERGAASPPFTLRTAAPADGALDGVARRVVLALAAAQPGLVAIDERPPDPAEQGAWTEAFLTNAVRGVQPLTGIVGPEAAWTLEFGGVPGPVTAALAAGFGAALAEHATRLPRG